MLTRDVRLEGWSTTDWVRLLQIARPAREPRPDEPAGGIVALTTGPRLRKLVGTRLGRLDPRAQTWPLPLEELAARHCASWAVQLHTGALEELMGRFGERLRREHDLSGHALLLLEIARELEAEGALAFWPQRLSAWPVASERLVLRGLDAFCPDGRAIALGAFEAGEVYTALVARRRGAGFDLILGPDGLRSEMGLVSGDWRRDWRHLARAAEHAAAPLALGCFAEATTLRRLAARPAPGAWAAAVAARDVMLAPAAAGVAIPLGIDLGRAAFAAARGLAERLGASGLLTPLEPTIDRLRRASAGEGAGVLGFDLMKLLERLLG